MKKVRKIVFHIRPWEVGLYTALEDYISQNSDMEFEFLYITHHVKTEYLLKKIGRDCLNINRELKKISMPHNWRERLQALEDRCPGNVRNFQQYLAAERFLKNKPRDYQMGQLYRTAVFFDAYFEKHKPFFMLSNAPDHMAFWLAMDLLIYHGGHPCGLVAASWPKSCVVLLRHVGRNYWARELYVKYIKRGLTDAEKQEASERQAALRSGQNVPVFIRPDKKKLARKRPLLEKLKTRMTDYYWEATERRAGGWHLSFGWHIGPIPIPGRSLTTECRVKLNAVLFKRYIADRIDWNVPFVFFPLHLEPEATVLVRSNCFDNQLEVIRLLSKALPVSWKLLVKDHPNMLGRRSWEFIRAVKQLPNVILVRNDEPSWKLIQHARLVTVLTGTAGLEACILGKPVLAFGNPEWGYGPTFRKAGDITKLYETLLETVALELSPEDKRVQAFLLSWMHSTPPGIYDHFPWLPPVDHPDNVLKIGKALNRLLHELDNGVPFVDQPASYVREALLTQ